MVSVLKLFSIFAVVFTTAIFLSANSIDVTYIKGKVESIEEKKDEQVSINDLEVNASITPTLVIASGKGSRIEARSNKNIWRLGSLSVAKWYSDNKFWLHSGSALYCSQKVNSIQFSTREANATFEGKGTIIIEATSNGGFKFIPLEAKGTISTKEGGTKEVISGRMMLILGNPSQFGDAFDIDLLLMVKSSRLLNEYPTSLPSIEHIGLSIYVQQLKLKGKYNALIGDATTNENLQMWKFGNSAGTKGNIQNLKRK